MTKVTQDQYDTIEDIFELCNKEEALTDIISFLSSPRWEGKLSHINGALEHARAHLIDEIDRLHNEHVEGEE